MFFQPERNKSKKKNQNVMLLQFSLVTKVIKEVFQSIRFAVKSGQSVGVFLTSPIIEVVVIDK